MEAWSLYSCTEEYLLGKKVDRRMGEGIPAFSLRPPFLFYKQRISAFEGDGKQGIYMFMSRLSTWIIGWYVSSLFC